MNDLSIEDYVIGVIAACWLVALLFFLPAWLEQAARNRPPRAPQPPPPPDWSRITEYTDLSSEAWKARHDLSPDAFLEGPFRRFLEIASEPKDYARVRARMMEFGRGSLNAYCESLAERGGDAIAFEARARAMAAEWFARPQVPDGDYMLEVLDGVSTHNYRGKREA